MKVFEISLANSSSLLIALISVKVRLIVILVESTVLTLPSLRV